MVKNLYDEFSRNKKGVFTDDFLKDVETLAEQYVYDWKTTHPTSLLLLLRGVEAHDAGVYLRVDDKYLPNDEGLDEDNVVWDIEPYFHDTISGLIIPSPNTWQYNLFIEELKKLI